MNKLFVVSLLFVCFQTMAQQKTYTKFDDDGTLVYQGQCTFADIYREPSFGWMRKGVDAYTPGDSAMHILAEKMSQYQLVVFLGTWCSDSKDLVPKLYKVLDQCHYPITDIAMYGVDMKKTTGNGDENMYEITNVPTIILFDGKKEVGRITESVHKSVEEDLAEIIDGHRVKNRKRVSNK